MYAQTIPQSKIKDFCQLPLHKGAFLFHRTLLESVEGGCPHTPVVILSVA